MFLRYTMIFNNLKCYTLQIFRINLNWMTLADIALLHNTFNLSITRLAISYSKHNILMLTEKYIAFVRHVVVLDETRISM